jgi:prepilin-type N-terminal cleavage/methylation domain-containing protein
MTALDHLRKLTETMPYYFDEGDPWRRCIYCSKGHSPTCPWLAAKAFVEAEDQAEDQAEAKRKEDYARDFNHAMRLAHRHEQSREIDQQGFTLIELLVVLVIILLVSIAALPTVLSALSHRQVSEGARVLQAQLAGARDAAIRDNAPRGIRLLPDPTLNGVNPQTGQLDPSLPLAANRMIPIGAAPDYTEGSLSIYPPSSYTAAIRTVNGYAGCPCLVIEEAVLGSNGFPNPPTSWFWNIRVGDKIQIGNVGAWYTVVGPMTQQNAELFVNVGPPGTQSPLQRGATFPEFLLLVNGRDDNGNGLVDEGFNGRDDNYAYEYKYGLPYLTDELAEWETEIWLGAIAPQIGQ